MQSKYSFLAVILAVVVCVVVIAQVVVAVVLVVHDVVVVTRAHFLQFGVPWLSLVVEDFVAPQLKEVQARVLLLEVAVVDASVVVGMEFAGLTA